MGSNIDGDLLEYFSGFLLHVMSMYAATMRTSQNGQ
jgi:hypothetical protein